MELLPYFLGFAILCTILSIGLQRRTPWMWYLGWVILYLFSGYLGTFFLSALYYANSPGALGSACIYLIGGLVLWLPAAVYWATHRHLFIKGVTKKPLGDNSGATSK